MCNLAAISENLQWSNDCVLFVRLGSVYCGSDHVCGYCHTKSVYLEQNEVTLFVEMFAFKSYVSAFAIIFGYNFIYF